MKPETLNSLTYMQRRASLLCGLTAAPGNLANITESFKDGVKEDADSTKKMAKLIESARNNVAEAITELNELRMQTIDLYIRATSNFATLFFRMVSLQATDEPGWTNSYRNPVNIRYIGEDGGVRLIKAVKAQSHTYITMKELATDGVSYPLRDIQRGIDVAGAAQATVDTAWDMANKMDVDAKTLLDTLFAAFNSGSGKLNQTWLAHPRIVAANLPTTNDLSLADNTGSTKFRLAVIRAIIKYCAQWGQALGQPLSPTGVILVPSIDITDLATEITPTGSTNNAVADGILKDYRQFDYMGIRWTLVPDVTLASGVCYPVLNMPVGEIYTKPSMDEEWVETNKRKNLETRGATKVIAYSAPEAWRMRTCRVTYHS